MQAAHLALARSRAYALFGRLYRAGLTTEVLPVVHALPDLAEALDAAFDAEQAAADHYDLFLLNVFPYASLYLDAMGQVGSAVTEEARDLLRQSGYDADTSSESADHVTHALGLLAFLTRAETDAWEDERPDEAARMQHRQAQALGTYVLWWLPAFTQAVRQQGHAFYTRLADLTLDLVIDHHTALGPLSTSPKTPVLSNPPLLLDDEKTGLKEIAAFLTTHARSGLYLSRADIGRLSRRAELPRGFGTRTQMLANLLRAAVSFGRLDLVLTLMAERAQAWQTHYSALAETPTPVLEKVATTWQGRLEQTAHLINRIRTATLDQV